MDRAFIEDSQAGIKISPQDINYSGISDRLVTVTGTLEEQMRAVDLILSKLSEDQHYSQSINTVFSYAAAAYNPMNYTPNGAGMKFQNNKEDRSNSMTNGVGDEHIRLVLGRAGRNIMEISQLTGTRIKVSDRGDFMSGTNDRYPYEAICVITSDGYVLLLERIPRRDSRKAVYLQHGILESTMSWVSNRVVGSPAFAAFDQNCIRSLKLQTQYLVVAVLGLLETNTVVSLLAETA